MDAFSYNNCSPIASAPFSRLTWSFRPWSCSDLLRWSLNRLRLRGRWIILLATLLVGVSLGLPLFLYLRERQLEQGRPLLDEPETPLASLSKILIRLR